MPVHSIRLQPGRVADDSSSMLDDELHVLDDCNECRDLLWAYRMQIADARQRDPEWDGWVPRLHAVEGIDGERLSHIHGKLIALGLLSFQLAGRASGMRYRVTSLAKRALSRIEGSHDDEEEETACGDAAD